jgi:hypothetical protein
MISLSWTVQGRRTNAPEVRQLACECPLPILWGLSFVGPYLRVYHGDVATGSITTSEDCLEEAWNINFLSPEGFAIIQEIVGDIVDDSISPHQILIITQSRFWTRMWVTYKKQNALPNVDADELASFIDLSLRLKCYNS